MQKLIHCDDGGNLDVTDFECSEKCWFYFMMLKNNQDDDAKYALNHIGKCPKHEKYIKGFL
jgi:hypothetical protein